MISVGAPPNSAKYRALVRCFAIDCLLIVLLAQSNFAYAQPQALDIDALVEAAGNGDLNAIRSAVESGQAVDSRDGAGVTLLLEAAYAGHHGVVEYLLKAGADPNARDDAGAVPLAEALSNDHVDVALILLQGGASADITDSDKKTPLHRAIELKNQKLMRAALAGGAKVNAISNASTALVMAITQKDVQTVQMLLDGGADPNRSTFLNNPVSLAARSGQKKIIGLLLKAGADLTDELMHYAAFSDPSLLKTLLAREEARSVKHLNAALDGAIKRGDLRQARELLRLGGDVNLQYTVDFVRYGPPLFQATRADRPKIAKLLIEAGADVNGTQTGSMSPRRPISWAALHNRASLVEEMIRLGADTEDALFELYDLTERGGKDLAFSPKELERAVTTIISTGAPADEMVRYAILDNKADLVRLWYPNVLDWGSRRSGSFRVAPVYEELIDFANEISDCRLKRGVKQTFTAKTGYRPPKEYDRNYREIPDRC